MKNKILKNRFLACIMFLGLLSSTVVVAQTGEGGTKSLFNAAGVGARALALGNAFVAVADDPSAVYWNPGGLDFIQKKSATFFYSSLGFGTTYNFVGLAFPTMSIGTFGFGWIRIGTNDVTRRDDFAVKGSTGDVNANQFLFSYSKQLRKDVSIGLNVKFENQSFAFTGLSDTGVGGDLALLYRPHFESALLRNLSFGVNVQNIVSPKIKLKNVSESAPIDFKIGLAKPFLFGENGSRFTVLFAFDKSENAPSTIHAGAEYSFEERAVLRVGLNDTQVSFGAGAVFRGYHFDYNYGKLFDGSAFSANHRFSVGVEFGKGKDERIRLAQEKREKELRLQVDNRIWFEREQEFHSNMEDGRTKYYSKHYIEAYVDFTRANEAADAMLETAMRFRGEYGDDPEANMRVETANSAVNEAQTMLELANTKSDSVRKSDEKQIYLQAQKEAIEQELQDFIFEHRQKGLAFFKGGLFSRAINEWQLALDRINRVDVAKLPGWVSDVKLQLENNIKTAEEQLQGNVQETIKRANSLARRGQYVQALNELQQIRATGLSAEEKKTVDSKIRFYQNQLNFKQNFDEGVRNYSNKLWKKAADAFARALKIRPRDKEAKDYFEKAKARSIATIQDMPTNVRAKYLKAVSMQRNGKYREALNLLEQCRKEQPYNKRILDRIDRILDRLKK